MGTAVDTCCFHSRRNVGIFLMKIITKTRKKLLKKHCFRDRGPSFGFRTTLFYDYSETIFNGKFILTKMARYRSNTKNAEEFI